MFFKTSDLKNSAIFTRKHLCWSLFLIKLFWSSLLKWEIFNRFCYRTPVRCFWPDHDILWMINELIAFSSCAMSFSSCAHHVLCGSHHVLICAHHVLGRVSLITNMVLWISRYKIENHKQKFLLIIFFYFCLWNCVIRKQYYRIPIDFPPVIPFLSLVFFAFCLDFFEIKDIYWYTFCYVDRWVKKKKKKKKKIHPGNFRKQEFFFVWPHRWYKIKVILESFKNFMR